MATIEVAVIEYVVQSMVRLPGAIRQITVNAALIGGLSVAALSGAAIQSTVTDVAYELRDAGVVYEYSLEGFLEREVYGGQYPFDFSAPPWCLEECDEG